MRVVFWAKIDAIERRSVAIGFVFKDSFCMRRSIGVTPFGRHDRSAHFWMVVVVVFSIRHSFICIDGLNISVHILFQLLNTFFWCLCLNLPISLFLDYAHHVRCHGVGELTFRGYVWRLLEVVERRWLIYRHEKGCCAAAYNGSGALELLQLDLVWWVIESLQILFVHNGLGRFLLYVKGWILR